MTLPVQLAVARTTDELVPLATGDATAVPPGASFEIRIGVPLPQARLVLLDAQDALVAGTGETEIGRETRFTFAPAEPLRAGGSFLVRVEGVASRAIPRAAGGTYLAVEFAIRSTPRTGSAPEAPTGPTAR